MTHEGLRDIDYGFSGMTQSVLIVDDNPFLRMHSSETIEEYGFHILEAGNARQALKLLETKASEIVFVLTGVRMPGGIDGIELAGLVKKRWSHIRVAISADVGDIPGRRVVEGVHLLPKPWRALDLIDCIMKTKSVTQTKPEAQAKSEFESQTKPSSVSGSEQTPKHFGQPRSRKFKTA
jgi:DNA-binding NtrC family response regulator